ncbi:MAG TPA: glycosyltransferase [Terracidiphilus sp.]|nr:glycosyltransferase [Terracidiphilus sp.]
MSAGSPPAFGRRVSLPSASPSEGALGSPTVLSGCACEDTTLRVLQIVPSLRRSTGGPAQAIPQLCSALQSVGVQVELMTFAANPSDCLSESFPVRAFQPFPGTLEFPTVQFFLTLCKELARFDVVNLHSLWNPVTTVAAMACRQAKVPYVISPMGMLRIAAARSKSLRKTLYYHAMDRRTIAGAAALTFFTELEAAESRQYAHGCPDHVLIPNGIDPSGRESITAGSFRARHPELGGKRVMLFLGRLHSCKNLGLQLQAFNLLASKFKDLTWLLVGPDAGEWDGLSSEIQRLGLQNRVLWVGPQSHDACLEALADSDVCVLTSHHEGHSMAMNEALLMRAPLVMTGSVGFEIAETAGAALVTTSDPAAIADAITEILSDPGLVRRMQASAQSLIDDVLAWPRVAIRLSSIYENIAAGKPLSFFREGPRACELTHAG